MDNHASERFARVLFADAPEDAFVELRVRRGTRMAQSFRRVAAARELAAEAAAHATRHDVYMGVIARKRQRGGRRDLVLDASVTWVDCDDAAAVRALERFEPAPQIVVASGSGSNRHAYWLLAERIPLDEVERINRGLALVLGADVRACDSARILRPPGTVNWKTGRPAPVRLLAFEPRVRLELHEISRGLPRDRAAHVSRRRGPRARTDMQCDPLLQIAPREYVERLTGSLAGPDRKLRCPFHDDKTPSLHVFEQPERGWFCFGCGRGGSIYDFAAMLWGRGLRGSEFVRLRQDLHATLLPHLRAGVAGDAGHAPPPPGHAVGD